MKIGAQAEQFAILYLQRHGLRLIVQNYHCRFGEIDLILQDGESIVFVEVRLRSSSAFGGAAASIDSQKQRKLICTAQHYLAKLAYIPQCRFDAVLIQSPAIFSKLAHNTAEIVFQDANVEWIKNAFGA